MNIYCKIVLCLSTVSAILLGSCSPKSSGDSGELTVIKFEEASEIFRPVDNFKNISCIQLEMTDESVLGEIRKIIDVEGNLVVLTKDNEVVVFSREDGKYLRHIGGVGEGPEEYIDARDILYDSKERKIMIYDRMRNDFVSYRINGDFVGKKKLPKIFNFIQSIENSPNGTILISNQIAGGLSRNSDFAFTLITSEGICEDFDPFAPVTVNGLSKNYAIRPMSVCNEEFKLVKFLSDTVLSIKNDQITPLYKLEMPTKMAPKKVAAEMEFGTEFSRYCSQENFMEGISEVFETERYMILVPMWVTSYGYYWIDKENNRGFHIDGTPEIRSMIRKVVEGKSIVELFGYSEDELISCFQDAEIYKNVFSRILDENPDVAVFQESVVDAIKNIDPDGNPFLLIYSN